MWAIVGSSGFERFDDIEVVEELPRETPFGLCSNGVYKVKIDGHDALFLCRTGQNENLLPYHINYRANIYALKKYRATAILALTSVRSLRPELAPGDMVVPYQYIDRTKGSRISTFCDDGLLAYVSLTHPIAEKAAEQMRAEQDAFAFNTHFGQAYVCIEGPQFPTMIDARCYQTMGGGIIGMTAFPEFALAREAGLHYLPCHFVVDFVPWGHDVENVDCIFEVRHQNHHKARQVISWVVDNLTEFAKRDCHESGIASAFAAREGQLTPEQSQWIKVLQQRPPIETSGQITSRKDLTLAHDTKPIPQKLQDLLHFVNKYHKDGAHTLTSVRKNTAALNLYAEKAIDLPSVKDFSVKLTDREITVRLYHPNPEKNLPIMIYAHGGGFISGNLDAFDSVCRHLSQTTARVVISVEYRLAPEFPYPHGLNDVYEVACWISQHAADIKASSENYTLAGDSAGANMVALSAYRAAKSADFNVDNLILIYPSLDLSHETESRHQFGQGYLTNAQTLYFGRDLYLSEGQDPKDPNISPYYIDDCELFPRTLILTAGYDPLRDEGLLFAEKLIEHKVHTEHYHFPSMIHAFINFAKLIPDEMQQFYERVREFLVESTTNNSD